MAYNESPHDQAGPGAMAVGVLESSPETKVALRLSDDGRLMVEVAGLAIDADIIDLDMNAITGTPPNNASLYDVLDGLLVISGGTDLWNLEAAVASIGGEITGGSTLDDVYGTIQILSGGTDLWNLENLLGEIKSDTALIDSDVMGVIQSLSVGSDLCDRVEAVHLAVEALGGGVDLSVVDGDVLRCADSLWAISAGDSVSLQAVVDAVNGLKGTGNRTLTDIYNALTTP